MYIVETRYLDDLLLYKYIYNHKKIKDIYNRKNKHETSFYGTVHNTIHEKHVGHFCL